MMDDPVVVCDTCGFTASHRYEHDADGSPCPAAGWTQTTLGQLGLMSEADYVTRLIADAERGR